MLSGHWFPPHIFHFVVPFPRGTLFCIVKSYVSAIIFYGSKLSICFVHCVLLMKTLIRVCTKSTILVPSMQILMMFL